MSDTNLTILEVRLPQENEFTFESMSALLANFTQFSKSSFLDRLTGKKKTISSLEVVLKEGQIRFYVVIQTEDLEFFRSQILAQYSTAAIKETPDYLDLEMANLSYTQLGLAKSYSYPIKTTKDFKDTDPLNSVLAPLSRSNNIQDFFVFQIILASAPKNWQGSIIDTVQNGILVDRNSRCTDGRIL